MKKILLIAPGINTKSFSSYTSRLHNKNVVTVPLHLATLAALTPDDFEVQIWDEAAQGLIDGETDLGVEYDLVGVTAYYNHLSRAKEIGRVFRKKGIPVIIGGAGATSEPESVRDIFDVLFLGEAELTWPQFLADFRTGSYAKQYGPPAEFPEMSSSPPPRWDSIAHLLKSNYRSGGVQVNRGCPFNCEFCSSWQTFGRKMRSKTIAQVIEEVKTLERLGLENILICTENFVGDPRYAKELLRALIPLNNSFAYPMRYFTELTITISRDEEMLRLLADANFVKLLIGIESPNIDSLKETRKRMNIHGDLVDQCMRIQSYGMLIQGSMIVGFDHDTTEIFDQQFEFLQAACIPVPKLNILTALKGTELYHRLLREGRLIDVHKTLEGMTVPIPDNRILTNVLPKKMTRAEMLSGYLSLIERVWDWKNFEARIIGFIDNVRYMPERNTSDDMSRSLADMRASIHQFPAANREVIDNIFSYTERRAPSRLWDVGSLVIVQCEEAARMPGLRVALENMISIERSLENDRAGLVEGNEVRSSGHHELAVLRT